MAIDLSVILPVINERDNLVALIPRLGEIAELFHLKYEIVVVDGGSTDGTGEAAAALGARVIARAAPGYGGALREGFAAARGDYILTLDADLSHDPGLHREAVAGARARRRRDRVALRERRRRLHAAPAGASRPRAERASSRAASACRSATCRAAFGSTARAARRRSSSSTAPTSRSSRRSW